MKYHFQFKAKKLNKSTNTIVHIDENYKWSLQATKIKESPIFEIQKYNGQNSCSTSIRRTDHRRASYMIIETTSPINIKMPIKFTNQRTSLMTFVESLA